MNDDPKGGEVARGNRATSPPAVAPDGVVAPTAGHDPDGHLATGWEPHRPLDDGLVRRFVYAYASSFTGPVRHLGGRVVQRDDHVVWDLGRPAGFLDGAMLLRPLPFDGWTSVVDQLEEDLAGGSGTVMLFSPWQTPDLSPRGWHLEGHPPLMIRTHGEPAPPVPSWLELRAVDDAATLRDWERVAILGYPMPEVDATRPGAMLDDRVLADPAFHAWVAYADGDAIAVGASYVIHGINVFVLGATLPSYRGRGVWEVLARCRLAAAPGLPAAALFSDLSRSPAQRLGFVPLQRWTVWTWARP